MRSICCTVTNDLTYDQRMNRICSTLADAGYDVTLVGRKKPSSHALEDRAFKQKRLNCWFQKGKLFYIEYNIRLWFFLWLNRFDIICGIDLDTILPTYYMSRLKKVPFVYDAHEYFTEMEEVVSRPMVKKVWKKAERLVLKNLKYGYTVSDGYAKLFKDEYGVGFEIIRNATVLRELEKSEPDEKYILYQGAVNHGRGLETLIYAMRKVDCKLYICGKGDVYDALNRLVEEYGLEEKVKFWGYVKPEKLVEFTSNAHVGITIFTKAGLSNTYSLANRFFDYFHSGVPQLAMKYPEYINFNKEFEVAHLLEGTKADQIAEGLNLLLNDKKYHQKLKENCLKAREVYNWQTEARKLVRFYERVN